LPKECANEQIVSEFAADREKFTLHILAIRAEFIIFARQTTPVKH
jgi:hypothetical protein